jgi:adenylate kinase family enzyme
VRYLIYGVAGAGKTSLARGLASRTGIVWHDVDALVWQPGWVQVPVPEQRRVVERMCATDAWILDYAHRAWIDVPLARADVLVALDYPRWLSLWRVARRAVARAIDQQPICGGNVETWRQLLSRDSIVVWHFKTFGRTRTRIRAWADTSPGPEVVRLTSPRQTRHWLATVERSA